MFALPTAASERARPDAYRDAAEQLTAILRTGPDAPDPRLEELAIQFKLSATILGDPPPAASAPVAPGTSNDSPNELAELQRTVAAVIAETFNATGNDDVADKILQDPPGHQGDFARLCRALAHKGGGTAAGIRQAWQDVADQITEYTMNRIASGTLRRPALFLSMLV